MRLLTNVLFVLSLGECTESIMLVNYHCQRKRGFYDKSSVVLVYTGRV